jgi:hypothetical protein
MVESTQPLQNTSKYVVDPNVLSQEIQYATALKNATDV